MVSNASRGLAEQANQSVADNKKNKREEGKQASAFVASWLQVRDALLQQPIGLLKSQHWMEAELLITNLRNHTAFVKEGHISPQQRIESMFLVLDRLGREISQSPTMTSRNPRNMGIVTNAVLPLDSGILVAVLVSWRDFLFSTVNLISRSSNAGPTKKDQGSDRPLNPVSVLNRVKQYMDVGLFRSSDSPYNVILHVLSKVNDNPLQAALLGDEILQSMLHRGNQSVCHPTATTIYGVVELWAQSTRGTNHNTNNNAALRCEQYLQMVKDWYPGDPRQSIEMKPIPNIYCAVMEAHSHSSPPGTALKRIQELFAELKEMSKDIDVADSNSGSDSGTQSRIGTGETPQRHLFELDTKVYARVCHALALCRHPEAPDAAHAVLDELVSQSLKAEHDVQEKHYLQPTVHCFSDVISAYGRAGRVQEAQDVFDSMKQLAVTNVSLKPDLVVHSALIWAYAQAKDTAGAEAVVMQLMEDIEQGSGGNSLEGNLNSQTWNGVLVSWAQSGDAQAADRISMLLDRLKEIGVKRSDKNGEGLVTTSSYNALLACYAQEPSPREGAHKAEKLFQWMETQQRFQPDGETFIGLLLAWKNAGDPERCHEVLEHFLSKVKRGDMDMASIDQKHFSIVIEAWAKSRHPQAGRKAASVLDDCMRPLGWMKPNTVCYTSLLWAWARSPDAMELGTQLERIYQQMLYQWRIEGDTHAQPNSMTLNALCYGLSRSSDPMALESAHQHLANMKEMGDVVKLPSVPIYNTLMAAWSKRMCPERCERLFQELVTAWKQTGDVDFRPHAKAFNTRLNAWSKAGNAQRTTQVLQEWIFQTEQGELDSFPSTVEFNVVLQSWVRSKDPNKATMAERGLRQMLNYAQSDRFACHPDVISYTTVITAYADVAARSPPFARSAGFNALRLLKELKQLAAQDRRIPGTLRLDANFITYGRGIVALMYASTSPLPNGHQLHAVSVDPEIIRYIRELFQELHSKDISFWTEKGPRWNHLLTNIRTTIQRCALPSPLSDEFFAECNHLEHKVRFHHRTSVK